MASWDDCSTFPDGTMRTILQVQAPRLLGVRNPKLRAASAYSAISVTTFFQLAGCCAGRLERYAALPRPSTPSERTPVAPFEQWRTKIMQRSSAASPVAAPVLLR